jgi:phospholipid N-methyltransferase
MAQHFDFLRESIRNLRNTGSVARSSRYLCKAIVEKIDPAQAKVVVELGPGDGVITEYILRRIGPDARLIIFEINEAFIDKLHQTFPDESRLTVIHDSAENMGEHFKILGIEQVDYIVSGIPFVMLPETLATVITTTCKSWLRPAGLFIQFHYSPLLVSFYKRIFGNIRFDIVPINIPPALVLVCERTV